MFAIVNIAGKQYKVAPGQTIIADRLEGDVGDTLTFSEVLLTTDGKATHVGTPKVTGVTVKAKIVAQGKGKKIEVYRFKSKVRYRKHIGFRPSQTKLEILSVGK